MTDSHMGMCGMTLVLPANQESVHPAPGRKLQWMAKDLTTVSLEGGGKYIPDFSYALLL